MKLIYFFSDNKFGYAFYLFCMFYGFFGCTTGNCTITHSVAAFFVTFMIGLAIQTYILVKIPFTRNYLENLVGKSVIEKYLGKYTGSEALTKIIKYTGPVLVALGTDSISAHLEAKHYFEAAEKTQNNFEADNKRMGREPSHADWEKMQEVRDKYINQAANAKGLITRGFAAGAVAIQMGK